MALALAVLVAPLALIPADRLSGEDAPPGWLTPAGDGLAAAMVTLAGGWLLWRLTSLIDAFLDDRGGDRWDYLRESLVPLLLAAATVALGAGWVA